ncbi:MAG TPA: energy transducer TonB [Chitinophagaceae bacterium]|nr:energy transducer TonB [Chitinophagaceae bacterium]
MKEGPPYHYSAEDIQRYIQGKMNPEEMHALEKAALEDPFLADAIEGIREMQPDLDADLAELTTRLSERTKQKTVKVNRFTVIAAAALVISISLAAWLFFRESDTPQIAKLEETQAIVTPDSGSAASASSVETSADSAASEGQAPAATKISPEPSIAAAPKKTDSKTGSKTAPTPAATSTNPTAALADLELNKSEAPMAKKTMAAPVKDQKEAEITMASKEVSKAQAKSTTPVRFETLEMAQTAEPVTGWSAFAKYIASNMQRPTGASAGIHGTVPMTFVVSPDGSISDVRVEKSLHPEYDKEAVRLLQGGPKWKAKNSENPVRAKYVLVF